MKTNAMTGAGAGLDGHGAVLMTACAAPEFKQRGRDAHGVQGSASARRADGSRRQRWKQGVPAERQPRGEWWLAFNDPALKADQRSHPANANLAVAAARVKQARAIAGIAEADRIPQVGVNVGAQRSRASAVSLGLPPVRRWRRQRLPGQPDGQLRGGPVRPRGVERERRARRCAGREATYRSVLLAVQADVAQTYFRCAPRTPNWRP
jgi:multidrug efflux system outer membrane protein